MIYYSQKDNRWANVKLGTCSDTIAKSGCKITCLASFAGITPPEANKIIPYVNGCLTNDQTAAKALGLEYDGKSTTRPSYECIVETDFYKSKGVPQHFFILTPEGLAVDPLDLEPKPKKNPYNIVSYRLFKPLIKEEPMNEEFAKAVGDVCGEDYGKNLNDGEQKEAAKKLKEVKEKLGWCNQLELTNARLLENNGELSVKLSAQETLLKEYIAQAGTCEPELKTCRENLRVQTEKANGGLVEMSFTDLLRELKNRIIKF
jgi:hypothetical protein